MPKFYFDVLNDGSDQNNCATELADFSAAKEFAVRYAGRLLADGPPSALSGQWCLCVRDSNFSSVFELTLLAITVPAKPFH